VIETQPRRRPVTTVALRRQPLLGITRLDRTGGVDTLLTAFGLLAGDRPRLRLDIVGEGPLDGMLHTLAVELGLDGQVRFRGPLPWHRIRAAMQRCAAVVLPHQDDGAGAGGELHLPMRSALELGRPLVATDRAAPPDVADLMPGARVVPARNPTVLATALAEVVGPPDHGRGWSRRAWRHATG
jgi:glycosyltransferase involved in cell wall biosynthesis